MDNTVRIQDYDQDKHRIDVALSMVGLNLRYEHLDLMLDVIERVKHKKPFTIDEAVKMKIEHERKWESYYKHIKIEV